MTIKGVVHVQRGFGFQFCSIAVRRRGAALRGVVACFVILAAVGLLVYGAGFKKRTVVVESEVTVEFHPPPPPQEMVEDYIRRGLPPPRPEPPQFLKEIRTENLVQREYRTVRDVTVDMLKLKDGRLWRLGVGDGPAFCPT